MRLFTRIESCDDRQRLQFLVLALIQKKIPAIVLSDQEYIIRYEIFNKQELKLNDQVYINEIKSTMSFDKVTLLDEKSILLAKNLYCCQ